MHDVRTNPEYQNVVLVSDYVIDFDYVHLVHTRETE